LYNGMWRYTGLRDLQNIIKAVFISSATIVSIMLFVNRFQGFSRAVFVMDAIICLLFLCTSRISIRFLLQHTRSQQKVKTKRKKRLLLIGAGDAAEKAVREIADNPRLPYEVVGFVDDNPTKTGMRIHGIPVLGTTENLGDLADQARAEELLIAIAAMDAKPMKRIVDLCQQTGLSFKVLPGLGELIEGKLSVTAMRDISYSDLLGRAEVKLDQKEIGCYLTDRTILVTGAGGSIGSELCRQIIKFAPQKLIIFDAGEENLYNIQMELEHTYQFSALVPVLGNIQNKDLLNLVFTEYSPSVVFHAAAYKHVPLVESNPWEAIFNNVFASRELIRTAISYEVKRFVLVSTDKAVRPTNVMGATKRLTELILLAYYQKQLRKFPASGDSRSKQDRNTNIDDYTLERPETTCIAVRFGNVLGSSGSVIPLFKRQIERGGPVTVTDPEITRYFMSIEEAAQLILQAGAMGCGGEIFLLKMGAPVKILNLAHDLIKLMGHEPETEIKITFTGLRPGEKLYEELITVGEGIVLTGHEKIMVIRGDGPDYEQLEENLAVLKNKAERHDARGIKEVLKIMIPEYSPDTGAKAIIKSPFIDIRELQN
ncbi:polysaccharide biosynthesis protein, partial [Candidatus Roizmanbacteria bacterium]|nr:polysaccharide biosynthesis protein [Candidatus Roizmanbacteria bacterium]